MPKIADCFTDRTTTDISVHEQFADELVLKVKKYVLGQVE